LKASASKLCTIKAGTVGLSESTLPLFRSSAFQLPRFDTYPQANPIFLKIITHINDLFPAYLYRSFIDRYPIAVLKTAIHVISYHGYPQDRIQQVIVFYIF